ncbi:M48 family metallopeptidase [Bosea vestrisii]|uniref:M48 family metallopeptidase n=1 Tax=Bosea vestrisii TaxID=151416 RepID=UPI0024DFA0FD|nr:M48 family metallopeptidase [Bosea vestrisii]WID97282.1 M48 family metallopeptidase [Bosea vestrisii]
MNFDISQVKHPKEKLYGSIMLVVGTLIWVLVVGFILLSLLRGQIHVAVISLLYFLAFWLFSYWARALTRAYMIGHFVMVGPDQFPHLHRMVEDGARALGLREIPQTFVYNSSGVLNAMALRLVGRQRYIWLTSALLDADNDEQVRFVIGHELGHHVAGHLDEPWSYLRLPGHVIPFLGAAYSRGRELTCDRIGAFVARDLQAARTGLQMLACGSAKLNAQMNADAFQKQEQMVPGIAGFFLKIVSHYPRHTRRVEAVTQWSKTQPATNPSVRPSFAPRPA